MDPAWKAAMAACCHLGLRPGKRSFASFAAAAAEDFAVAAVVVVLEREIGGRPVDLDFGGGEGEREWRRRFGLVLW